MAKNTLTLRKSNIKCISTITHPFGVGENYKGHHIRIDLNETIPLDLLTKDIKSVEEGKPIEEFHMDYSGKSYATKARLKNYLKKSIGYDYTITNYSAICKKRSVEICGYKVEAVRTDYLKDYTISEKDKKRLEKKKIRELNKKLKQTFIIDPLTVALQNIDDRLCIYESRGCIFVSVDVLKYLGGYITSLIHRKKAKQAYKEFLRYYSDSLRDKIIKTANTLGLNTIEELPLKHWNVEYDNIPLLMIRKVTTNLYN